MKQRLKYLDALKAFTILLVICGHCIQYLIDSNGTFNYGKNDNEIIYRIIYSFHMPLFMMLSGFFAVQAIKRPFIESAIKRARMLLLPVITTSLILAIIYAIVKYDNVLDKFIDIFSGTLWFLKTAFTCFILTKICYMCGKYKYFAIAVTLIFSQFAYIKGDLLCFITNFDTMYPAFVTGVLLKNKWSYFEKHIKNILYSSSIIFITMLLFFDRSSSLSIFNIFNFEIIHPILILYVRCYKLIVGLSGSIFFISLFYLLFNRNIDNKVYNTICYYGQNTLGIYILQFIILEIGINGLIYFDKTNFFIFIFLIVPFISIAILLVCMFIIKFIKKNKYTKLFLLGEK